MENIWRASGKGQQSILGCEHVSEPSWEMHTSIHPELHTSREVGDALGVVAFLPLQLTEEMSRIIDDV